MLYEVITGTKQIVRTSRFLFVCPLIGVEMSNKSVYVFGPSRTDGAADMKNTLGGKGANLAEMCRLGISRNNFV